MSHIHAAQKDLEKKIFCFYYIPVGDHGCAGHRVEVKAKTPREGVVENGFCCIECHRLGYDDPFWETPMESTVLLPDGFCWICASEERGDRTAVTPPQLKAIAFAEGKGPTKPSKWL